MRTLLEEIRHNPLLWRLLLVPVLFAAPNLKPGTHAAIPAFAAD